MKNTLFLAFTLLGVPLSSAALSIGDIGFVGFNADGDDDFAFVALSSISAGEEIFFTDDEWNGTSFNTGEGFLAWTAPAGGISEGQVITIEGSNSTADFGTVLSLAGSFNLAAGGDQIFAYQASAFNSTPSVFISALTSNGGGGDLNLTDTGLSVGTTAVDIAGTFGDGRDGGYYDGSRNSESSFSDYLGLVGDAANWGVETSNGELAVPNFAGNFTTIPEPSFVFLSSIGFLSFMRRRR